MHLLCLLFVFFFCALHLTLFCTQDKMSDIINTIEVEDRQKIENFLRIFLFKEGGAYVLFGDKPAAITHYFPLKGGDLSSCFCKKFRIENEQIRKGWETWKKYSHLFSSSRFILEGKVCRNQTCEIVLINKDLFKKTLRDDLDFTTQLKTKKTASNLLEAYESSPVSLFELLEEHHGLLGILLGFGKNNSALFHLREKILKKRNLFTMGLDDPSFDHLVGAFTDSKTKHYKALYLPNFLSDRTSEETKTLRQKYLEQRHTIFEAYKDKNFLHITFQKLCE